jgi:hypothetical protein
MINRKQFRDWGVAAIAFFAVLPAAVPAQSGDAAIADQDRAIQALKEQALDVEQKAQSLEDDLVYPASSRVSVYVGEEIPGILLKQITVSIDNGEPVSYTYKEQEALALSVKGIHRVLRINTTPGAHRIHAAYSAQFADARDQQEPFSGSYDGFFEKGPWAAAVELELESGTPVSPAAVGRAKPELKMRDWRAAQ